MVRLFTDDRATRSGGKDQAELLLRAIKLGQRRRFVRRPADLTVTGLAKALPYSWAALGSRNKSLQRPGASRSVRAARKYSGSPRSEDLPSVALNTQRALCEPVIGPLHHRSSTFSKIPCKFPANSLLPQKNSLLGIQKFPAPLRREFGNRGKFPGGGRSQRFENMIQARDDNCIPDSLERLTQADL